MITIQNLVEKVIMLAGLLATAAFPTQGLKIRHSKSAQDVSLTMFVCFWTGIVVWVIYGFMLGAFPVILVNVATLCIAATILAFKARYG